MLAASTNSPCLKGICSRPWKSAPSSATSSCPTCCSLPQLAITLVFFYWPASQAAWTSFRLEDAFGTSSEFVGFENYQILLQDHGYYDAMGNTAVFSAFVAGLSLSLALLLAVMADKQIARRHGLPHAADLALRRRARHRRRALAVHVPALARHDRPQSARARHRLEPAAQRHRRHVRWSSSPRPGSRSATISCSSWRACSRSPRA